VYAGIAGSHVRSLNSHGIVAIKEQEVVQGDVERVIDAAKAVAIPADQKILHVLPQEYIIDAQEGIRRSHRHVRRASRGQGAHRHRRGQRGPEHRQVRATLRLERDDIVLEQLASSYAVLTEDEKDLGVCVVDIGGGTTDIAVFGVRIRQACDHRGDQVTQRHRPCRCARRTLRCRWCRRQCPRRTPRSLFIFGEHGIRLDARVYAPSHDVVHSQAATLHHLTMFWARCPRR